MKKQVLTGIIAAAMAMAFASCGSAAKDDGSFEAPKTTTTAKPADAADTTTNVTTEAPTEATEALISETAVFEKFINGEIKASMTPAPVNELNYVCTSTEYMAEQPHVICTFEGAESLSLSELTDLVRTSPDVDASGAQAMYSYFNTASGDKALAVKYQGVGIDGDNGFDSSALFLFVADGDSLRLTYCDDSWSRKNSAIYSNGMIKFSGSNGAGDEQFGCAIINGDGNYRLVYSMRNLRDQWVAMYDTDTTVTDHDWAIGSDVYLLNTYDRLYYSYTADNTTVNFEYFDIFLTKRELQGYEMIPDANAKAYEELSALGLANGSEVTDWIALD